MNMSSPATAVSRPPLVRARDLCVSFAAPRATVNAVNGVNLDLAQGESLCILGESGSGKSVTLRAMMRLNPPKRTMVTGELSVADQDVMQMTQAQLSQYRGPVVSMIFQEPLSALDPVFTIGHQIAEAIVRHEGISRKAARARALSLLEMVQIPSAARRLGAYPHELSGGLRQRAMIAMALSCNPRLLLADEPTTALDATVQIQILLLLRKLQQELGMGVIFVTHDIGVASEIADRVAVMYGGRVVEEAPVETLIFAPRHPYTCGLLGATVHAGTRGSRLTTIPGAPPDLAKLPAGCAFAPRCTRAEARCHQALPPLLEISKGHRVRCPVVCPPQSQAPINV
ncbi:ABC transporter ATP-binding protein [Yoonia vestfoldensis]|uniref:Oligopeptide transport ATP-binding protein OppD n=1 Tax=Yoonia vestfoldensis TaxID=245188 RepID=A0A1Y0ECB4_9RHOB|nr:ABC transporter ATP-binding protein [Yoonia vestfoldensis]ARU01255.1 oligopeptide transport ATP-binding protein OppD [Yoonia vestfoldensis]